MLKSNGENIYYAMADKGLSVTELSEKAKVSRNTIYRMKRGYLIRPEYAGRVAKALGVDIRYIIQEEKEEQ